MLPIAYARNREVARSSDSGYSSGDDWLIERTSVQAFGSRSAEEHQISSLQDLSAFALIQPDLAVLQERMSRPVRRLVLGFMLKVRL